MIYRNPFKRLYNASLYSVDGLIHAVRNEQAFRYEAVVFIVLCTALTISPLAVMRRLFLVGMWLLVMALELVNSSVERAFDLIDENFRPEIKAGKDMLSASIFIMVCFNVFLWAVMILL
ncbi:MAG: diacylglycerol kinase [Synergistaceae bacterium]|nr:diacylglycerol kinase [Synergistaceae bacterium]